MRWVIVAALLVLSAAGASAQVAIDIPALAAKQAKRFPQPVLVGSLLGRDVLEPRESQPVLGRVSAITRRGDDGLDVIILYGGTLGLGGRTIAVPAEAVALLGPYLAVMDFTPEQLDRFPTRTGPLATKLAASDTIKMGLTRPFH